MGGQCDVKTLVADFTRIDPVFAATQIVGLGFVEQRVGGLLVEVVERQL